MKRISMFIRGDQLKKLLAISQKTGAPVSELVRRAIDEYVKKFKAS